MNLTLNVGSRIRDDAKCDRVICRRIGIAKDAFLKLSTILRNSERWTISSQLKWRQEATGMWFKKRMLTIPCMEYVRNEEAKRKW